MASIVLSPSDSMESIPVVFSALARARIVGYYDERMKGTMIMCHLVLENENLTDEEELKIVEEIVYKNIIGNPNMSSRQIPAKFKIRESIR